MALKAKIDQASFDKLHELFQEEYTKQEDGSYTLAVEGLEDTGALKRAKDHEKELRLAASTAKTKAEERAAALQAELDELRGAAKGSGDKTAETERLWKDKYTKREAELQAEIEKVQNKVKTKTLDAQVAALASELAGPHADILEPHLRRRLIAELAEDGNVNTKILDADGEPSAITMDELKKEFLTSPRFAPIVVASKATGSGAAGARKGSGGAPKKLSEMTGTEEVTFAKQNPVEYKQMLADAGVV